MNEQNQQLHIIFKVIQDIWNSQKNVVLCKHFIKDQQKMCLDLLFIRAKSTIIVRYDQYNEKYEDATDLYIHAILEEFNDLEGAIGFILEFINLKSLYQLFELNYGRKLRKISSWDN